MMRKYFVLLLMTLCTTFGANAQNNTTAYTREGNTFMSSTGERVGQQPIKTKFTWKDSKGKEYPIYISKSGSCFVIKVSAKTGKEYRNYLGPEISQQICKELGIEYKLRKKNEN